MTAPTMDVKEMLETGAQEFPPLYMPCPVRHSWGRGMVEAKFEDGTSERRICASCLGDEEVVTPFGWEVLRLVASSYVNRVEKLETRVRALEEGHTAS